MIRTVQQPGTVNRRTVPAQTLAFATPAARLLLEHLSTTNANAPVYKDILETHTLDAVSLLNRGSIKQGGKNGASLLVM